MPQARGGFRVGFPGNLLVTLKLFGRGHSLTDHPMFQAPSLPKSIEPDLVL